MKIIIVEGVDGAGKTTLVNELSHLAPDDAIVAHCGPLKRHPLHEYLRPLESLDKDAVFIADRWHVGESVYGPLYRGASRLTPEMASYIEAFLDSRGAARIVLSPPYDVIKRRLQERGESFLQPQHLRLVCDFYGEFADNHSGWTRVDGTCTAEDIYALGTWSPFHPQTSYVGPISNASMLLVGEERSHRRPYELGHLNPFVPYTGSSGHHLFSAMRNSGFLDYGVMDVNDPDLPNIWQEIGYPPVIGLGDEATRLAGIAGVPCLTVYHPAEAMIHGIPVTTYGEVIAHAAARR